MLEGAGRMRIGAEEARVGLARSLAQRGLQQAARFTWAETARQTLAAYQESCHG